jgi:DNA-binding transcriptional LysR family regulator
MDHVLELRHLRYFVAVAEELHFGRAARRLHMAQPPLSQQIRRLEQLVGSPLLTRTSRRVADLDEAGRIGRGEEGRLDVGFISSAIPLGITERIRAFRQRYPAVHVQLHEGFTTQIVARVFARDIDMGIVRDITPDPGLEITTLATEGFVAVLPAGHPLAGRAELDAALLRDEPFVFYPRSAGEQAYLRNLEPCRVAGYEPRVVQEGTSWVTLLHLVGAGLGVTIAPRSATVNAPGTVRVLELCSSPSRSEVQIIRRAGETRAIIGNFLR